MLTGGWYSAGACGHTSLWSLINLGQRIKQEMMDEGENAVPLEKRVVLVTSNTAVSCRGLYDEAPSHEC